MFRKHNIIKDRLFIITNTDSMIEMNEFLKSHNDSWVRNAKKIEGDMVHYLVRYEV